MKPAQILLANPVRRESGDVHVIAVRAPTIADLVALEVLWAQGLAPIEEAAQMLPILTDLTLSEVGRLSASDLIALAEAAADQIEAAVPAPQPVRKKRAAARPARR